MLKLNSQYWDQRYKKLDTPWDLGQISVPLKSYIDQIRNMDIKILIPGAGSAYEAFYLEYLGFKDITVIDLSKHCIDTIKLKSKKIKAIQEDFFEHRLQYDLILEQTFFCAIQPNLRSALVSKIYECLYQNGKYTGLFFNRNFDKNGPPFGGSIAEYKKLFQSRFKIKTLAESKSSYPGRIEAFFIFQKV